jgi:hypothetical protein
MHNPLSSRDIRRSCGDVCRLACGMFFVSTCVAQVALDHSISVGRSGDKVYLSSSDPKIAYFFPYALIIKGEPRVATARKVVTVHFVAGVDADYIDRLQKEVTKVVPGVTVRLFRGMNSIVLPNSVTDVGPEFAPVLLPLGDPADFAQDVEYALTLRRRRCWFSDRTRRALDETFKAKEPRNVGVIEYSFAAVVDNQTITGKTSVPLFVGGK